MRALQLLERYGVLTREMALAEGAEGGFAGVYPVLKADGGPGSGPARLFRGRVGAPPSSPCRERSTDCEMNDATAPIMRSRSRSCWRPAIPAQPYGAALAWPESEGRPSRSSGAFVVDAVGRTAGLPGARGPKPVAVPGGRRATMAGSRDAEQAWCRPAKCGRSRSAKSMVKPLPNGPRSASCSYPAVSSPATAAPILRA